MNLLHTYIEYGRQIESSISSFYCTSNHTKHSSTGPLHLKLSLDPILYLFTYFYVTAFSDPDYGSCFQIELRVLCTVDTKLWFNIVC